MSAPRQKSGPAGNSATFFSASGLMTSVCCAIAVDGSAHSPDARTATTAIRIRFMGTPRWFSLTSGIFNIRNRQKLSFARFHSITLSALEQKRSARFYSGIQVDEDAAGKDNEPST